MCDLPQVMLPGRVLRATEWVPDDVGKLVTAEFFLGMAGYEPASPAQVSETLAASCSGVRKGRCWPYAERSLQVIQSPAMAQTWRRT